MGKTNAQIAVMVARILVDPDERREFILSGDHSVLWTASASALQQVFINRDDPARSSRDSVTVEQAAIATAKGKAPRKRYGWGVAQGDTIVTIHDFAHAIQAWLQETGATR